MKYPDITLGRIEAVWNKLGGEEGVQRFLAGQNEVHVKEHIIDLDAQPFVPDGWKVEEHKKNGLFVWNASEVSLYLSDLQTNAKSIFGTELRKELIEKAVFNVNLLDYLLRNSHLIPEEWKKDGQGSVRNIFFWGTIYSDSSGKRYVRALFWDGAMWYCGYDRLDVRWTRLRSAALRIS